MVEKSKSRGQRGERKWPTGVVSKGLVSVHLVPVRQQTAERVATQEGGHRQVQIRTSDDRHTRGRGMPGTRPLVAAMADRVERVKRGPRGTGEKETERRTRRARSGKKNRERRKRRKLIC